MDPKELFARSVGQATGCMKHLDASCLSNATPCTGWNVKQLLNHMVYELRWVPDLLAGKTIADIGNRYDGDLLGSNPKSAWQHAADTALVAVKHVDLNSVVHLSYGDVPAKDYIDEIGGDILVHSWDLDQGMNCSLMMESDLAQYVYDKTLPKKEDMAKSSLFAPALTHIHFLQKHPLMGSPLGSPMAVGWPKGHRLLEKVNVGQAPAVDVPEDVTIQTKLLALFGRKAPEIE